MRIKILGQKGHWQATFYSMKQIPQLGKQLGKLIQEARKSIPRLSQEKLADALGTERAYISRLERGLIVPSVSVLLLLGEILHTPASSMLLQIERDLATSDGDNTTEHRLA